jgi:hypothetical protein
VGFALRMPSHAQPRLPMGGVAKRMKAMRLGATRPAKPFDAEKHPRDAKGRWAHKGGLSRRLEVKPPRERFRLDGRPPKPRHDYGSNAGRTPYLYDMKKGDLPGQTSLLDRVRMMRVGGEKAQGRGTEDRLTRARQIREARAREHWGTADSLRVKNRPLGYERVEAERLANRIKRNTKNTQALKDYLASGGQAVLLSMTKPKLMNGPGLIVNPSQQTGAMRVITGYRRDKSPIVVEITGDQQRYMLKDARRARALALRAKRAGR